MNFKMSNLVTKPDFQGEFTASILAAAASPDIISFAGGLPNPVSFPIPEMEAATKKVLAEKGAIALQYSSTPGYPALREWVAKRYETMGVYGVTADDIIITNGSQQALAMVGASMIDAGDEIIVEDPTYLVALQSFHMFDPKVLPVTINSDGIDCDLLEKTVKEHPEAKLIYIIPNFQNPTGLTYSKAVHDRAAEILKASNLLVLEDNPYSELRFEGEASPSFGAELGEQCCMLGTFSKIVARVCASAGSAAATRRCGRNCWAIRPPPTCTPTFSARWCWPSTWPITTSTSTLRRPRSCTTRRPSS